MGNLAPALFIEPGGIHHQRNAVLPGQDTPQGILVEIVASATKEDDADHEIKCAMVSGRFPGRNNPHTEIPFESS